jgi:16S rRNA G966 N2-methylase RsmD
MGEIVKTEATVEPAKAPLTLAERINAEHRACETAAATAIQHAIRCGELLLEAKETRRHGGWMDWLQENFDGSQDLANKYMRVAKNQNAVMNLADEGRSISLRGALEEIKTQDRKLRDQRALERAESLEKARIMRPAAGVEMHHCDFRDLKLTEGSVDLIFTDPPYPGEYLPLWEDLSRFAARVLSPGAMLVAYSGQYHLLEVMNSLAKELEYLWLGAEVFRGPKTAVQGRKVQNELKPLLFYRRRGDSAANLRWSSDTRYGEGPDKEHHHWGQSVAPARYYIERLTKPGAASLVVDPFLGGGTTAIAAQELGRSFVGCDVDWSCVVASKDRLAA